MTIQEAGKQVNSVYQESQPLFGEDSSGIESTKQKIGRIITLIFTTSIIGSICIVYGVSRVYRNPLDSSEAFLAITIGSCLLCTTGTCTCAGLFNQVCK